MFDFNKSSCATAALHEAAPHPNTSPRFDHHMSPTTAQPYTCLPAAATTMIIVDQSHSLRHTRGSPAQHQPNALQKNRQISRFFRIRAPKCHHRHNFHRKNPGIFTTIVTKIDTQKHRFYQCSMAFPPRGKPARKIFFQFLIIFLAPVPKMGFYCSDI